MPGEELGHAWDAADTARFPRARGMPAAHRPPRCAPGHLQTHTEHRAPRGDPPASLATCPWSSGQALQVKPSTTQRPHNSAFYSSLAVGVTRPGERAGEDVGWAAATARGHREAGEQPADSGVADTRPAGEVSSHSHCGRGPPTHGFVYKNSLVLEPKLEVPPRALSLKSHVVSDTWTPARPDGPCFPTAVP